MTIDIKTNRIYHYDENRNCKEHKSFSTNFTQYEILKDGKVLVLEDYLNYNNGKFSNLYCLNQELDIEWFLAYRSEDDQYTSFSINGNRFFAFTWNGFKIEFNKDSGEILDSVFTK